VKNKITVVIITITSNGATRNSTKEVKEEILNKTIDSVIDVKEVIKKVVSVEMIGIRLNSMVVAHVVVAMIKTGIEDIVKIVVTEMTEVATEMIVMIDLRKMILEEEIETEETVETEETEEIAETEVVIEEETEEIIEEAIEIEVVTDQETLIVVIKEVIIMIPMLKIGNAVLAKM